MIASRPGRHGFHHGSTLLGLFKTVLAGLVVAGLVACGGGGSGAGPAAAVETGTNRPAVPAVSSDDSSADSSGTGGSANTSANTSDQWSETPQPGFEVVSIDDWTQTSVRKVLKTFAYNGLATDEQILAWAGTAPQTAIAEMLTFSYSNEKLSPMDGETANYNESLRTLQEFWSSDDSANPVRWNFRKQYNVLLSRQAALSPTNLQRTWVQAVSTRGVNPFLHKITFFLTNYQMAVDFRSTKSGIYTSYYDAMMEYLVSGIPFTAVIAEASKSATVSKLYAHRANTYDNDMGQFSGNDDFAREYFQLFFRIQGEQEHQDYHEFVTIENNARVLTGMDIDREYGAYGSGASVDHWLEPINFTDHIDGKGNELNNGTNHHADCLEILREQICGATAEEKIDQLSPLASKHPEALSNLPIYIIETLADDRLTEEKKLVIRQGWLDADDDLLEFIRSYAISTTFHDSDTIKYQNAFDRNISLYNAVVLDNHELLTARKPQWGLLGFLVGQGASPFSPAHDVFGGQTGLDAARSTGLFKKAYEAVTENFGESLTAKKNNYYTDSSLDTEVTWSKDWRKLLVADENGDYIADEVASFLWQRINSDGLKNYDVIARSQILALLVHGKDFGLLITELAPAVSTDSLAYYSSEQLTTDPGLLGVIDMLASTSLQLNNNSSASREEANTQIDLAVSFIAALPYTFVTAGQ